MKRSKMAVPLVLIMGLFMLLPGKMSYAETRSFRAGVGSVRSATPGGLPLWKRVISPLKGLERSPSVAGSAEQTPYRSWAPVSSTLG